MTLQGELHEPAACFRKVLPSTDEAHALVLCSDRDIRILNLPTTSQQRTVLLANNNNSTRVVLAEPPIDAAWCPFKKFEDAASFITSARGTPIQMWDCADELLRASYCAFNDVDEVCHAQSVAWTQQDIIGGYGGPEESTMIMFDALRPGREYKAKYRSKVSRGRVSVVAPLAQKSLIVLGHLNGQVEVLDSRHVMPVARLSGHRTNVFQVGRSPLLDSRGMFFTSSRRSDAKILLWDLRNLTAPVVEIVRELHTQQPVGSAAVDQGLRVNILYATHAKVNALLCSSIGNGSGEDAVGSRKCFDLAEVKDRPISCVCAITSSLVAVGCGTRKYHSGRSEEEVCGDVRWKRVVSLGPSVSEVEEDVASLRTGGSSSLLFYKLF